MALKACVRAKAARERYVPYRQSKLTQVLKRCFDDDRAVTYVIATVSPASKDTEHTMNTLSHAGLMDGQGESAAVKQKVELPPVDLGAVARAKRANPEKKDAKEGGGLGGPRPKEVAVLTEGQKIRERKRRDREGLARLDRGLVKRLQTARAERFENARQWQRLTCAIPAAVLDEVRREAKAVKRSSSPTVEVLAPKQPAPDRERADTVEPKPEPKPEAKPKPPRPRPSVDSGSPPEERSPFSPRRRPSPSQSRPGEERDPGAENAFALYWQFVDDGRECRNWSKNDLRLINASAGLPVRYTSVYFSVFQCVAGSVEHGCST
jgi:hypothetical protein